jgi:beta-galactosidase
VPYAENLVKFSIEGDGTITGVDNGSQTSMEPFKADFRKAFHGKCLLVVKAGTKEGMIRVKAYSEGLTAAGVDVHVR